MKIVILLFILVIKFGHADSEESFSTRLSNKLSISGHKCLGHEVTAAAMSGQWSDYTCPSKEWLIKVDDINLCSDTEGWCTEVAVKHFFGKMKISSEETSDYFTYYNIIPTIPVSPQIRWILRRHWLRVSLSGEIMIVHKR